MKKLLVLAALVAVFAVGYTTVGQAKEPSLQPLSGKTALEGPRGGWYPRPGPRRGGWYPGPRPGPRYGYRGGWGWGGGGWYGGVGYYGGPRVVTVPQVVYAQPTVVYTTPQVVTTTPSYCGSVAVY